MFMLYWQSTYTIASNKVTIDKEIGVTPLFLERYFPDDQEGNFKVSIYPLINWKCETIHRDMIMMIMYWLKYIFKPKCFKDKYVQQWSTMERCDGGRIRK